MKKGRRTQPGNANLCEKSKDRESQENVIKGGDVKKKDLLGLLDGDGMALRDLKNELGKKQMGGGRR